MDLRLLRALQLSQFSAQYLLASKKMLEEKKHTIHEALKTFQEEEDVLDIKIAKLKARRKAMNREMEEMDRIADSFTATLKAMKRSEGSSKKKKKHSQDTADLRSSPIRKEYGSESSDDSNNQGVSKKYNHKLIIPKLREGEKNVSKKHRHGEGRYKSASNHPDDDEDEDHEFYGQVVEEVFEVSKKLKDRNGGNDNSKGWKTAKPNASTDGMENDRMIRLGGRSQLQEDEHPEKMFDRAESPPLPQIRPLAQKLTSKADFPKPSSSISIPSNEDRDQVKENLRDNQASNSNIAPNSKVVQVGTRSSMGGTTLTTPAMSVDSLNYTMPEEDNRDSRDIMSNMKGPRGQDDGQDEGFGLHRNQKIFKSLSADPDDEVVQKYRSKYEEDEEEHVGNDKKQFSQTMPVISSQVLVKSSPLTVKSMEPAQPAVQEMSIIVEELDESMRQPVTNPTTNRSSVGASVDTTYENESFVSPTEPVSNTRAETKDSSFDYAQAKNNSPPVEDEDKGADVKRQYGQRFTYKHEEVDDNYFANLDKKEAQNPTKPNQTAPKYPAPAEGKPSTLTVEVDHTQDIIAEPLSTMDSNYAQDFDDSVAGVDTSRSLIVDLDFPMDDDIQPPKSTSKFGSTNSQRNTPNYKSRKYDDFDFEDDDEMNMGTLRPPSTGGGVTIQESLMDISGMESGPPTRDFPSDRSSPSTTVNFGTISSHHPGGTRFRDDQDDDMVLMGTSKFASGTVDSSLKSRLLSTNGTENFEKDSLGGTFGSAGAASAILNGHRKDTLSPLNDSITPPPLSGVGPDRGLAEMSYDSVLGDDKSEPLEQPSEYTYDNTFEQVTGETFSVQGDGSTLLNTNNNTMDDSEVQHALNNPTSQSTYNDTVESMEYSLSGPRIEEAGYNTLKSNATGDTATTPLSDSMLLQWNVGKAPIDLLELASAFEVHISAVRLNDFMLSSVSVIAADVEFLDFKSPLSPSITLRQDGIIQPISFFARKSIFSNFLFPSIVVLTLLT